MGRTVRVGCDTADEAGRVLDLVRKRRHYEAHAVPEFWFVDPDAERVEVYRLEGETYAAPRLVGRGGTLEALATPGLVLDVDTLLGPS